MHNILLLCIQTIADCLSPQEVFLMRTTLDLPENLLNEAMKISHSKTKTQTIVLALQELVRKSKIAKLKNFKGKIDIDIDINTIRNRG